MSAGRPGRRCEDQRLGTGGEVYGRRVRLECGVRRREQQKFESPQALSDQIAREVEGVRQHADEETGESAPNATVTGDTI